MAPESQEGAAFPASAEMPDPSVKACVVFDSATGQIVHVHRAVTWEGAQEPSDDELADRALSLARDLLERGAPWPGGWGAGRRVRGELQALHVDHQRLDAVRADRVDLTSKALLGSSDRKTGQAD